MINDVAPVNSVNGKTGTVVITETDVLPSQAGQSGKFLKTDGSNTSWGTPGTGSVILTPAPSTDVTESGIVAAMTAGEDLVFGDVVYVKSDGKMGKGDADAIATSTCVAMSLGTIANNASGNFLFQGFVRNDAWTWTVGGIVYLSTTAGAITQTAPSGTDDVIQILGVATHADRMYFNPQLVQVEHT